MSAAAQPMAHWIQSFIEAQAAQLDAATNTQLAYARDLTDFAGWLAPKKLDYQSESPLQWSRVSQQSRRGQSEPLPLLDSPTSAEAIWRSDRGDTPYTPSNTP